MAGISRFGSKILLLATTICSLSNIVYAEELTADQYYERGKTDNEKSLYAQAIADFTAAINKNPEYWKAYANRGAAKFHSHDYKGAKVDLDRAIPHLPQLQSITDLKNAIDQELAKETNPNRNQNAGQPGVRTVYVPTYVGVPTDPGSQIMAMAANLRAHGYKIPSNLVKPFPTDLIHPQTGHLINSAPDGKSGPSSVSPTQTGGSSPGAISAISAISTTSSTTDNNNSALNGADSTKKMSAQDYFERGSEKSKNMDLTGAIKDFDECLNLDPKHALAYANRATAKASLGDRKGSLEDFDRACDLMPENPGIKELRDRVKQAIEQERTAH